VDLSGRDVLIVFLKGPTAGQVKTRLIPALGAEDAARLYRLLAEEEIRRTTPPRGDWRRVFFYAPATAEGDIAAWFPDECLRPQTGSDLGERMSAAFEEVFRAGARRAALIGTDVPWLSWEELALALDSLDAVEVVLGPAQDGGYCLIALRRLERCLFREVPWSTASVLTTTLERARQGGLSVSLLASQRDVDEASDLRAEWARLRPILERDPDLLARVARALDLPLR
jgi:rSAM/selenodomain-associated transferase 1